MLHGANDPRVTKREADQMVIALRDRAISVTYLVADNEGHGFNNPDNLLATLRASEVFMGSCLGGRVDPHPSPRVEARIRAMTVQVDTLVPAAVK